MPLHHQFKQRIRTRMKKTKESYSSARRNLLYQDIAKFLSEFEKVHKKAVLELSPFLLHYLETHPFWFVLKEIFLHRAKSDAKKQSVKMQSNKSSIERPTLLLLLSKTLASEPVKIEQLEMVAQKLFQTETEKHLVGELLNTFFFKPIKHPEAYEKAHTLWVEYEEQKGRKKSELLPFEFALLAPDGNSQLKRVEDLLSQNLNEKMRLLYLSMAARAALQIKEYEKASVYAKESLLLAKQIRKNHWDVGHIFHHGHIILGLISLEKADTKQAKYELLQSAKTPIAPSFDTPGPRLDLAKKLLEHGEKNVVYDFLNECKRVWHKKQKEIDAWIDEINSGFVPEIWKNTSIFHVKKV